MSWQQLLDIRKLARAEWERDPNVQGPPTACPNDGEPLLPGPPSNAGIYYCPYDGWQWPRDWSQPTPPSGLFDGVSEGPGGYTGPP